MKSSLWPGIKLVFRKELILGLRFKAAWGAMFMFALTTLALALLFFLSLTFNKDFYLILDVA